MAMTLGTIYREGELEALGTFHLEMYRSDTWNQKHPGWLMAGGLSILEHRCVCVQSWRMQEKGEEAKILWFGVWL